MADWRYQFDEAGLLALLRWAGATPWAKMGDALKESAARRWMEPVPAGQDERITALTEALTTIANEEGPEGIKPKEVAAFVLWGAQCYWCKGFSHPEAWTVGCQCAAAEPWEGWEG